MLVAGCELSDLFPESGSTNTTSEAVSEASASTPSVSNAVSEPSGAQTAALTPGGSSVETVEVAEVSVETAPVPVPPPEPVQTVEVAENNPRYSPGEVEIPAEFLNHGRIIELRYERCSLANGLLVHKSGYVYSIAPPSDPIWRLTDERGGRGIGTRARFADGTMYDGWVRDYTGSGPMPLVPPDLGRGFAFWVKIE
jgi:hypothetical protein